MAFALTPPATPPPPRPSPRTPPRPPTESCPSWRCRSAQRDMPIYLDGLGNVLASHTVTVHVQVDGKLERVVFKEGQDVKKGDLLAQIDARPFVATLNSAQGALARDQAQLTEAIKNLERFQELSRNGLTSQQSVDDQAALVQQLRGTISADQAAIDSARLSVEYARITSPIDGVTGIRLVDPGNLVHQTDPGGIVVDHHPRSHRGHLHPAAGQPHGHRAGAGRGPGHRQGDEPRRHDRAGDGDARAHRQPDQPDDGHHPPQGHVPQPQAGALAQRLREDAAPPVDPQERARRSPPRSCSTAPRARSPT